MKIKDFSNIKLSLKALRMVLENQVAFSEMNYLFASDVGISLDFIKSINKTLELMDKLFGNMLDKQEVLCKIENGIITN